MKIYVSHSTNFDYRAELYVPLRANFSDLDIFLPHEKSGQASDTKQTIKTADLVLAEVSYPSTGQGIELGWASDASTPIVCIHRAGTAPSSALGIITNDFIDYSSTEELVEKLREVL